MVKSNVRVMPKQARKKQIKSEVRRRFEDLERRIAEHDRELEETFKMADEAQRRLRLIYERR